jgi:hypothetical protein
LIGRALEEVARATASVGHFYRSLEIGPTPGNFRIHTDQFSEEFRSLIEATGSV